MTSFSAKFVAHVEALGRQRLLTMYEKMRVIRAFEDKLHEFFAAGEIPGFVHLYAGEEAVAVGVTAALRPDDYVTSTHRGHGHCLAKDVDLGAMLAEIFGRATGVCKGKGGSMHIADVSRGMLGANGVVGGGIPIAVGAALAAKLLKSGQVSVCYFGDGASNQGTLHESLNLAAIWDLPCIFVCENIMGAAAGAAIGGLRPVAELMFVGFAGVCLDQIVNQAVKFRYMFGGKAKVPLTIRTTIGAGLNAAGQHSDSVYSIFAHYPGLKCVVPATPADAKGLLKAAIRDDDPVVVFENKVLYNMKGPIPDGDHVVPLGKGRMVREGTDVTIVALSRMVHVAMKAADLLAGQGVSVEIIDPRSISPLDEDLILTSVRKTERLVVVDEDHPRCSMAADIVALATTKAFDSLDAAPTMIAPPHTPVPFSAPMEAFYIPNENRIADAVRKLVPAHR